MNGGAAHSCGIQSTDTLWCWGANSDSQLGDGTAEEKIERLELALVDEMRNRATPETAEQAADAMWGLVHARPDSDRVKQRVTELHGELARLGHRRI